MQNSNFSKTAIALIAAGVLALSWFVAAPSRAAEEAFIIPPPLNDVAASDGMKKLVLAGG